MTVNPTSFTYEHLSSLKFKELQKLSVQFQVNKRWAKKQELIENLLALKNNMEAGEVTGETGSDPAESEWRDGNDVFKGVTSKENDSTEAPTIDRRLTFNIDRKSSESASSLPDVTQTSLESNGSDRKTHKTISRETYEIPSKAFGVDLDKADVPDPRATFEVSQKCDLLETGTGGHRGTYDVPQNGKKVFVDVMNEVNKERVKTAKPGTNPVGGGPDKKAWTGSSVLSSGTKMTFGTGQRADRPKMDQKGQSQVKMLTIPCARVPRRMKNDEAKTMDDLTIKMSKKSINIKKTTRLPTAVEVLKSPRSVRKPAVPSIRVQDKKKTSQVPSKIPTMFHGPGRKVAATAAAAAAPVTGSGTVQASGPGKENVPRRILRGRRSEASAVPGPVQTTKSGPPVKVSFASPPPSSSHLLSTKKTQDFQLSVRKTPMTKSVEKRIPGKLTQSETPSNKGTQPQRPITATKMPDFSKIHRKQFEQMDSLHDYLKKKEERKRRLFGTPQRPADIRMGLATKSPAVFQFRSTENLLAQRKVAGSEENLRKDKTTQREAVKNRVPGHKSKTDLKDKARSHIQGVRTNKRFELQMKLRNM